MKRSHMVDRAFPWFLSSGSVNRMWLRQLMTTKNPKANNVMSGPKETSGHYLANLRIL